MKIRGVNYDVGIEPLGAARPSRPVFDEAVVRREIEIIRSDLHCNAIRIVGRDIARLTVAAESALAQGLQVWFSPQLHDASPVRTLDYLAECATVAERLRRNGASIIFVVGCELTFFMPGLVLGKTGPQRMQIFMRPAHLLLSTLVLGPFNWRLNRFLKRAVHRVRRQFRGPLTYASGLWEQVDWRPFDFVGVDCYRDAGNSAAFGAIVRRHRQHGKPVVITEFGSCTYRGAAAKGGYGWAIVDWNSEPPMLKADYVRDEGEQSRYLVELLDCFESENLEGAFVFTFVAPKYPGNADPRRDLDMASYALVRSLASGRGARYPEMPWEPKTAFDTVAGRWAS